MSKNALFVIISIFIISIGLRIIGLGDRALWADEKVSALCSNGLIGTPPNNINTVYIDGEKSTKSFSEIKKATLIQDSGNGLLYYLFLSYWTEYFGNSDYSLRFPSFLAGILFLFIGFIFVKKHFGVNPAILFLITSSLFSLFIIYSQTARSYELAILGTFASTFIFWEIIERIEKKANRRSILFMALTYFILLNICMFLHYYTFYIFAGHALYLALHHLKNAKLISLFLIIYTAFSIFFFYWMLNGGFEGYKLMAGRNAYWVQEAKNSGTFFNPVFFIKSFMTFSAAMAGVYMSYIKGFQVYYLFPFAIIVVFLIINYLKFKRNSNRIVTLFIYTTVIQLSFAFLMALKNGHVLSLSPYYNIFTIPYILILFAFISNEILKRKKYLVVGAFYVIFIIYNSIFLYFYYSKKNIHHSEVNNPYSEAALIIEKQVNSGDTIVSRQFIDSKLISLYTDKSFLFSYNPELEKDEIYIHKNGNLKISILNLEGKRY